MAEKRICNSSPLIKTQSPDRITYFRNGMLYCNKLSYFRKLEEEKGDRIIGDRFEAMIPMKNAFFYYPEKECVKKIEEGLIPTTWSDDYVFCMSGLLPVAFENRDTIPLIFDDVNSFGNKSLIILDTKEFIRLVREAAVDRGFSVSYGFVNYYDERYDNPYMIASLVNGIQNIAFWKRKKYQNQQEFRFVFHGDSDSEALELPLGGTLNGISKMVDTCELGNIIIERMNNA